MCVCVWGRAGLRSGGVGMVQSSTRSCFLITHSTTPPGTVWFSLTGACRATRSCKQITEPVPALTDLQGGEIPVSVNLTRRTCRRRLQQHLNKCQLRQQVWRQNFVRVTGFKHPPGLTETGWKHRLVRGPVQRQNGVCRHVKVKRLAN